MSEKQYYRKLLLTVQDKIRGLGATNRNRWAAFCYNKTMTYDEFVEKMEKYNVQFNPNDMRVLWDSVDVPGDVMDFQGFLKFMQADVDELVPVIRPRGGGGGFGGGSGGYAGSGSGGYGANDGFGAPPPRGGSGDYYDTPSYGNRQSPTYGGPRGGYDDPPPRAGAMGGNCEDLIHENLRDIIIGCMSRDSLMTGEISRNGFADVCAGYGIHESTPGFNSIISIGDPSRSGLIKYFTIAAHVCSSVPSGGSPEPMGDYGRPSYNDYPPRPAYGSGGGSGGFDEPPPRRGGYDGGVQFEQPPPSSKRTAYQSSIQLGDDSEPRQFSRGSSGGSGGGYDNFDRGTTDINEVLKNISVKVSENIGNSKAAFQKWRGFKDKLGAEEIRNGLIKDCQYNVPLPVIQQICARYGDPMGLTGFVRLMGDGTTIAEETPRKTSGGRGRSPGDRPMTEDDKTIENIALQLEGKDWETICGKCKTADNLIVAFSRLGCKVDENRIRVLVSKQGIRGFLDSISVHLGQ